MTSPVVIIGAGPAGLAAAGALARCGASAVVIDERPNVGGHLRDHPHHLDDGRIGAEVVERLLADLPAHRVTIRSEAFAWGLFEGRRVAVSANGRIEILETPAVVLAAGLVQQIHPFPGWTTPGVMTAHAARELLRRHIPPGRRGAVLGTTTLGTWIALELQAAGVDVIGPLEASRVRVEGSPRVRWLTVDGRDGGASERLDLDLVVLAQSASPLIELALQAGCRTIHDRRLGGYVPVFTSDLVTSQAGIFVAGGIIGAQTAGEAVALGRLAGVAAAAGAGAVGIAAVERVRTEIWDALDASTQREGTVQRLEAWRAITAMGTLT